MLACVYEDRPQQIPGLKLLVLSLNRYCPDLPVLVRVPGMRDDLRRWLSALRNVSISTESLDLAGSYNVKPAILLDGLSLDSQCLWLDTDILVNGDLAFLERDPPDTLITTQDPWEYESGSTYRCAAWGLKIGRDLPGPLNSAVVRVSSVHRELLQAWRGLLARAEYQAEQQKAANARNPLMLGDQDALSALAASADFSGFPVRRLLHASEILQHHGAGAYGLSHRLGNLRNGLPPLLHAMGSVKPWRSTAHPRLLADFRGYYERAYLELSPYVHVARQYRPQLEEEDSNWMDVHTLFGRMAAAIALQNPCIKGLTQATVHRAAYQARYWLKKTAGR